MTDPIEQCKAWLEMAKQQPAISEPTAMCLSTSGADNQPSSRIVLLKQLDARGFVFYTNLESRKSREIKANPKASLCFYWMPLTKQIRVEGIIEKVSDAEADAYFVSRARESQIGAWASHQSEPLADRGDLQKAIAHYTEKFAGGDIPRPGFWSGWRLAPQRIEFWNAGEFRLHEREVFTRDGEAWQRGWLYP